MSHIDYSKDKLWSMLVETVHAMVMYPHHKAYTREVVLNERPNIAPNKLAARMSMPLGEALVILNELKSQTE